MYVILKTHQGHKALPWKWRLPPLHSELCQETTTIYKFTQIISFVLICFNQLPPFHRQNLDALKGVACIIVRTNYILNTWMLGVCDGWDGQG